MGIESHVKATEMVVKILDDLEEIQDGRVPKFIPDRFSHTSVGDIANTITWFRNARIDVGDFILIENRKNKEKVVIINVESIFNFKKIYRDYRKYHMIPDKDVRKLIKTLKTVAGSKRGVSRVLKSLANAEEGNIKAKPRTIRYWLSTWTEKYIELLLTKPRKSHTPNDDKTFYYIR